MKKTIRSLLKHRLIILYALLLGIASFLIMSTLFDWRLYSKEDKAINIHYIEDVNKTDYKSLRMQGMNAANEDLNASLFVHPLPPNSDEFMNILKERPDAIIIGDYVHKDLNTFILEAKKQHIPVLLADYATADVDDSVYIGVDHQAAGENAARFLAPLIHEQGNVAIIGYHEEGSSGFLTGQGAEKELASYSAIHVKTNVRCTIEKEFCTKSIKQLLQQNQLNGIIALDAQSANDVSLILKQLNLSEEVKVVAFERSNRLIEYLQDGTIDALFIYNSFNLGYLSLQYAEEMANGKKVSAKEIFTTYIITKENMFWLQNQKLLFPMNEL